MDTDQALGLSVLGDVSDAMAQGVVRASYPHGLAVDEHLTAPDPIQADDGLGQLAPTGTDETVEPQDLSAVDHEGDISGPGFAAQIAKFENGAPVAVGPRFEFVHDLLAAYHQGYELVAVQLGDRRLGAGILAVAEHGDVIAEFEDLFELMTHEDDRDAAGPAAPG